MLVLGLREGEALDRFWQLASLPRHACELLKKDGEVIARGSFSGGVEEYEGERERREREGEQASLAARVRASAHLRTRDGPDHLTCNRLSSRWGCDGKR